MKRVLLAAMLAASSTSVRPAPPADAPPPADPAPAATNRPVAIEVFAALPQVESPKLSPDGTRVLARMATRGRQVLAILPLEGEAPPKFLGTGDTVDLNWWRWVGDDWIAAGVGAVDRFYGTEIYVTRTISASADMARMNRIDWDHSGIRADDVLWVARNGSPHLLLSRQVGVQSQTDFYPEVVDVDVSTGRVRRVVSGRPNVWGWFTDGTGQVRMAYRYNDQARRHDLLYRAGGNGEFQAIATRRGTDSPTLTVPLVFRADGTAIATSQHSGFRGVYEVSLPDLAIGRQIYAMDGYDVRGIVSNEADDALDGVLVNDTHARTIWFDPVMQKVQADIDKAIGRRRARIISWNRARSRFLVDVGGPSQPGAIYYYDLNAGVMKRFAWNNAPLQNRRLSPVTTIRYAARDGTPIEAVLTLPRGRAAKALPLIVMPHGGPSARDEEGWDWWAQYLAESGYAVIQPNYRGSTGYGLAFEKKAEGEWGLKMQDDLVDAIGWATKQGYADPKRVCIVGASYGGYAAMRAAERDKASYRCAVSYAGVSDLGEMRRYDRQFLNGNAVSDWLKKQAPDFRSVSPRYNAAGFGIPILLVHGKVDKRVPVKQSRLMADALRDAGKPFDYIEQPLADHHFSREPDRLEFLKAMKAFLDRYNPADVSGSS